jgi:hypothetical protein
METIQIANDLYVWNGNGVTYKESGIYTHNNSTLYLTIIKKSYITFDLTKNYNFISIFNQKIAILDIATDVSNIIIKIIDMNNQSKYASLSILSTKLNHEYSYKNINDNYSIQNILYVEDKIFIWSNTYIYIYEIETKIKEKINTTDQDIEFYNIKFLETIEINPRLIVDIYYDNTNIIIHSKDLDNKYKYTQNLNTTTLLVSDASLDSSSIKKKYINYTVNNNLEITNNSNTNNVLYSLNNTDTYEIINNTLYVCEIVNNTYTLYKINLNKINLTTQKPKKTLIYTFPENPDFLKLYINKPTNLDISDVSESSKNHIDIYLYNTNNKLYVFNNDTYCIINAPFPNKIQKTYNGYTQINTTDLNSYLFLTNIAVGDDVKLSDDNIWNYDTPNIGEDIHITSTKKIKLYGDDAEDYNLIYNFIDKPPVSNPSDNSQSKVYLSGDIIA